MIPCTQAFEDAVNQLSRTFAARFLYNGQVIDGNVRRISIYKGSCGAADFSPGVAYSSHIETTIDNCTTPVEGRELQLQIGVMTGGSLANPTMDYITVGYFTADRPSVNAFRTTFTAQGRISSKMSVKYTPPETPTLANIAAAITSDTGVEILFDEEIDQTVLVGGDLTGKYYREVLAILASSAGGYAAETADGDVRICIYRDTPNMEYTAGVMQKLPAMANYDAEITGIEVIVTEGAAGGESTSYSSGDPVNLIITDEHMTAEAFEVMAANMIGLTYRPGSVSIALGDPRLEPWDVCRVIDVDETEYIVPCMNIIHTFDGGVSTAIDAPGLPSEVQMPSAIEKATKIAISAMSLAEIAQTAATEAQDSASLATASAADAANAASAAQDSANQAIEDADAARVAANNAQSSADQASLDAAAAAESAVTANGAANSALTQLSTIEDVIGTLEWISEHGEYQLTEDTEIVEGKTYYTRSVVGDVYQYAVVTSPEADPSAAGYYELVGVDEAISNYIRTHLAMTNDGLYILMDNTGSSADGYKLKLNTTGMYVIDSNGNEVAAYSSEAVIGQADKRNVRIGESSVDIRNGSDVIASFGSTSIIGTPESAHLEMTGSRMSFKLGENEVAYVAVDPDTNESVFYMTKAIIVQELYFGNWQWKSRDNDNLALRWIGG